MITKEKYPCNNGYFSLVAIDRTTWNSIKKELVTMWQLVTDYREKTDALY